jgi:hypothetical protein
MSCGRACIGSAGPQAALPLLLRLRGRAHLRLLTGGSHQSSSPQPATANRLRMATIPRWLPPNASSSPLVAAPRSEAIVSRRSSSSHKGLVEVVGTDVEIANLVNFHLVVVEVVDPRGHELANAQRGHFEAPRRLAIRGTEARRRRPGRTREARLALACSRRRRSRVPRRRSPATSPTPAARRLRGPHPYSSTAVCIGPCRPRREARARTFPRTERLPRGQLESALAR